jgi:hypothetical protein
MMTISAPATTVDVKSINRIQIQFGTLCFGVKIEDDENNMVPVAPCQIKIEGRNFVKGDDGHIMTKLRMALLQGGRIMSSWLLKIFQQAIRSNVPENIIKNMTNWVVISWICGKDQLARGEGSKVVQIAEFTWGSHPTSPIRNSIRVQYGIPVEAYLKTDAHVAYDIQSWHSWTH